jgi:hypothetical protein
VADLGSLVVRLALMGAAEFREDMKRASAAVESFQSSAADFAEQARASFGGQVLETMVRFGAEAVTAFLEAEKASQRLAGAVARAAGEMPGFASHLEEAADAMERTTGVDGDYIKSLEQLALQLQVAPALIERTTRASLDWAAATGGSAKSAMQLLTKATSENLEQLKRWGVSVDASDVKTRGITAVLEQFEKVYGGASSQMHEASKSIALNTAAWGDLKEAIGQTITEMLHASGVASKTATLMDSLTEFLTSGRQEANAELGMKVAAEGAAIQRIANLTEKIREDEATMFRLGPTSPLFDQIADSLATSRAVLLAMEKDLLRMRGHVAPSLDINIPAVTDRAVEARNAIGIFERGTPLWEAWDAEQKKQAAALKATIKTLNEAIDEAYLVDVGTVGGGGDMFGMSDRLRNLASGAGDNVSQAYSKMVAGQAKKAAEHMREMASAVEQAAEEAKASLVNRALGSLGKLGGIIQNAAAAAAGGPLAVVASILLDVLTQSETFQRVVATLNGIVKVVADTLGQLLEPLLPLVGAVGLLITAIMPLAAMLIELAVGVVEPLTPIIVLVSTILQALMPVITVLAQAFLMIMNPLMVLAGPVLKGLFDVLKVVALVILHVAKAIGDAWNWIIGAIQSVFRSLADISIFGAHPLGFLDDWADGLESAKVDTDAMAKAISELTGLSYELALAKAKEAQASFENAQATKRLTDLNTPERWKRLLRTGEAADPQAPPTPPGSMPPGSAPPTAPSPGAPPAGGGLPPVLANGPIGGVFDVANDVLSGGRTPGGQSTLGNVLNIVNNVVVNGANSDAVLAEAEQRGYLTNQRAADSSVGTPVRIGPFQLSLG